MQRGEITVERRRITRNFRLLFFGGTSYTQSVDIKIVCKPSAFKHGVTENDIRWAFNTAKYDRLVEGFENKYLLIGFGVHGNLLEVMYNDLGENRVNVFHAMKCRNALLSLLNPVGGQYARYD